VGVEKEFTKVKLFFGFIYKDDSIYQITKNGLSEIYSPIELESDMFNFDFTTYYNREMGSPLFRRFVAFKELIPPERLPDIKLLANKIEVETSEQGNRIINLDPGYLSEANVIIATTKNYYHRIPLQKGIYAHMEYVLKGKNLCLMEWTYPDFKSPGYREFFKKLRQVYKSDLTKIRRKKS